MGLEMPPDQKVSQILSTWDLRAPVIMRSSVSFAWDTMAVQGGRKLCSTIMELLVNSGVSGMRAIG